MTWASSAPAAVRVLLGASLCALPSLSACGDDTAARRLDAGAPEPDACAASECRVAEDYGDFGTAMGTATERTTGSHLAWWTNIYGDCDPDQVYLSVELVAGSGAFADGIAPGAYALQDDDASPQTCGACIRMVADGRSTDARCYFASSGTIVLTEVEKRLEGQFEDVAFEQISCQDLTAMDSNCSSHIESLAFASDYIFTD